jgi:ABC-2 type transport system permease protein
VIAFLLTGVVCLLFVMAGFPLVLNLFEAWVPLMALDAVASLSFLAHFNSISKGVLSLQDLLYFLSMIVFWLAVNVVVLDQNQAR